MGEGIPGDWQRHPHKVGNGQRVEPVGISKQLRQHRLRLHGLIQRIPKPRRDQLTVSGTTTLEKYTAIDNRVARRELATPNSILPLKAGHTVSD